MTVYTMLGTFSRAGPCGPTGRQDCNPGAIASVRKFDTYDISPLNFWQALNAICDNLTKVMRLLQVEAHRKYHVYLCDHIVACMVQLKY